MIQGIIEFGAEAGALGRGESLLAEITKGV
jgi:hypothetical protein